MLGRLVREISAMNSIRVLEGEKVSQDGLIEITARAMRHAVVRGIEPEMAEGIAVEFVESLRLRVA